METRVLLAEDDPDDATLSARAIRRALPTAVLTVARDGRMALHEMGMGLPSIEVTALPQLVILDLKMPFVDGHEVLALMRAHPPTSEVCVIMFSSSDEAGDIDMATRLGASYLQKPIDPQEYVARLSQTVVAAMLK